VKGRKALFSSASAEWSTPQDLFDQLQDEFKFDLDAAASPDNAKCEAYFTKEDNGLNISWGGRRVWVNPPYGNAIGKWILKACDEILFHDGARVVVMLVPARTDTRWWKTAKEGGAEIRFLFGRLKFGGSKNSAPFPSAILIFRNPNYWRLS
jgi:phage N-6-adenine-methyltransferase